MQKKFKREFINNSTTVIIGNILQNLKGIILLSVIIKTVGVTIYGGFTLLMLVLGIIQGVSSFGTGFRFKRFMPSTKELPQKVELFYPPLYFNLLSITFFSFLFFLFKEPINSYLLKNEVEYSYIVIPFYLISYTLYSYGTDYFRYTSRIFFMKTSGILYHYSYIFLLLVLYYYLNVNITINVLINSLTFIAFLFILLFFSIVVKEIGIKLIFYRVKNFAYDIKHGLPLVFNFITDYILTGIDRYFIALYLTVSSVGIYSTGYVLGSLIIFFPKAMSLILPQLMSKTIDSNRVPEAERMLYYTIRGLLMIAIPFFFGSLILSKPILNFLANSEVAESGYIVVPIVAAGSLFLGLNMLYSNALFVEIKTQYIFKMNLYASIFNLIGNLVLLYYFRNILVAAITTFVSYFIAFLYGTRVIKQFWVLHSQTTVVFKSIFASLVMFVLLFGLSMMYDAMSSVWILVGEVFFGVTVYLTILFILKTFSVTEINSVKHIFRLG